MSNRFTRPVAALALLGLLATGCASCARHEPVAAHAPRRPDHTPPAGTSAAEIYLTGIVLHDARNTQDTLIDLARLAPPDGIPVAPYLPLLCNHETKFHVRHNAAKLHDYQVLLGTDPERDPYAEGQVRTSDATFHAGAGWIIMVGGYPVGDTDLVSTSAAGTQYAVRIAAHPDPNRVRHYVYNLEPNGSPMVVYVQRKAEGDTVSLPAGTFVAISPLPEALPKPNRIATADPFVTYIRERARVAGLPLE